MKFAKLSVALVLAGLVGSPAYAVDADAAKALAKSNDCFKCHAIDKTKKGPSLQKIAAKYKGKPDGQEKAIKNMDPFAVNAGRRFSAQQTSNSDLTRRETKHEISATNTRISDAGRLFGAGRRKYSCRCCQTRRAGQGGTERFGAQRRRKMYQLP